MLGLPSIGAAAHLVPASTTCLASRADAVLTPATSTVSPVFTSAIAPFLAEPLPSSRSTTLVSASTAKVRLNPSLALTWIELASTADTLPLIASCVTSFESSRVTHSPCSKWRSLIRSRRGRPWPASGPAALSSVSADAADGVTSAGGVLDEPLNARAPTPAPTMIAPTLPAVATFIHMISPVVVLRTIAASTPYGDPSAPVTVGRLGGRRVAFLPRHGTDHRYAPHVVPYRANMWALRSVGVRQVVSLSAVGSLRADLGPGALVLPDKIVDRTHGRDHTLFDAGKSVVHATFADPYCP